MVRALAGRGFTLIELTLAVVLLAVGLLALIGALVRALDEAHSARLRHAALRQVEGIADSIVGTGRVSAGVKRFGPVRIEWRAEPCLAGQCIRLSSTRSGHPRDSAELLVRAGRAAVTP